MRVELESDREWGEGKSGTDEALIKNMNEEEPKWEDACEEPLDEDGKPYFDPATPENYRSMMQAYNEKHKGMMDY